MADENSFESLVVHANKLEHSLSEAKRIVYTYRDYIISQKQYIDVQNYQISTLKDENSRLREDLHRWRITSPADVSPKTSVTIDTVYQKLLDLENSNLDLLQGEKGQTTELRNENAALRQRIAELEAQQRQLSQVQSNPLSFHLGSPVTAAVHTAETQHKRSSYEDKDNQAHSHVPSIHTNRCALEFASKDGTSSTPERPDLEPLLSAVSQDTSFVKGMVSDIGTNLNDLVSQHVETVDNIHILHTNMLQLADGINDTSSNVSQIYETVTNVQTELNTFSESFFDLFSSSIQWMEKINLSNNATIAATTADIHHHHHRHHHPHPGSSLAGKQEQEQGGSKHLSTEGVSTIMYNGMSHATDLDRPITTGPITPVSAGGGKQQYPGDKVLIDPQSTLENISAAQQDHFEQLTALIQDNTNTIAHDVMSMKAASEGTTATVYMMLFEQFLPSLQKWVGEQITPMVSDQIRDIIVQTATHTSTSQHHHAVVDAISTITTQQQQQQQQQKQQYEQVMSNIDQLHENTSSISAILRIISTALTNDLPKSVANQVMQLQDSQLRFIQQQLQRVEMDMSMALRNASFTSASPNDESFIDLLQMSTALSRSNSGVYGAQDTTPRASELIPPAAVDGPHHILLPKKEG